MNGRSTRVERLVVGGGIGGLAVALAVARRGLAVHVIEQASAFEEIGAGIQLAPNALRVLDELDVLGPVIADAVRPPMATLMDSSTGERIAAIDFGERFRSTYGYPYIVTHRTDLLNCILDGCRSNALVTLETDRHVVAVEDAGTSVRVECADGTSYEAGAVIGADGLWSTVRRHTVRDGEPAYIGDVAYRCTVPLAAVPERDGMDNMTWWIGPSMHLIQYPVRRGELLNQVAVFTTDDASAGGDPETWGAPAELDRRFAGKVGHVDGAVNLIDRSRRWILRDRPPVGSWTRGRATLLGDAAHPMAQYLAQGACQALEDAAVLAESLATHRHDVPSAFCAYEHERVGRTAQVQLWARRMGEIVHADGVLALLRDELLGRLDPSDFRYIDWLYSYQTPRGNDIKDVR